MRHWGSGVSVRPDDGRTCKARPAETLVLSSIRALLIIPDTDCATRR